VSSLYARLPAIKDDLQLSAGQLSVALLGLTAGLLAAQPLTGALVSRRGSAPATVLGAVLCAAFVVPPALAGSLAVLVVACVALGFANGMLDVAMNVQGVTVERSLRRPILSRLHATFSLGMLAAGAAAALSGAIPARSALAMVAGVALVAIVVFARGLERGDAVPGPAFARPSRALATLAAIAFAALLCEGAVADWSAVHLHETLGATESTAPLGLTAFALAMTIARLLGDRLDPPPAASGAVAALGLITAALAPTPLIAITGFALAGVGLATLFPTVVRKAGSAANIAAVSTAGYVGLVTGPPVVGALAEATSLRAALAVILGALSLSIVALAR
jgi:MFS family permease